MPLESKYTVWTAVGLGASIALINGCGALQFPRRNADSPPTIERSAHAATPGNASVYRESTPDIASSTASISSPGRTPRENPEARGLGDQLPTFDAPAAPATPRANDPVSEPTAPMQVPDAESLLAEWQVAGAKFSPAGDRQPLTIDATDLPIADRHLAALRSHTQLRHLNLRGTKITDSGLRDVSQLTALEFLGLSHTAVTDAGIAQLVGLTQLRYLTLADTAITDQSVPALCAFPRLQGLNVKGTALTAAGVSHLRAQLPNCKLIFDESLIAAELQFDREVVGDRSSDPEFLGPNGRLSSSTPHTAGKTTTSAETRLTQLLEERIGDPKVLTAVGDLYREQGDLDGAVIAYREALRRNPDDHELRFQLGLAEAEQGDWPASRENLTAAVGPAAAEYNHAVLLYRQGRIAESRAALQRALQHEPEFPPAHQLIRWLEQPSDERFASSESTPATLQLLNRALRGGNRPADNPAWKIAIQPHSADGQTAPSRSSERIEQALHQQPIQAGQLLNGSGGRRYDW